jgi:uncharacterized membrane protein YoaK (UPF0700 family)
VDFARRWTLETRRNVLVAILTVASGSVDAVGFLRLGGVFTSVMTANMVLLGVSAGRQEGALALHAGAAFMGYILGAFVGSLLAGRAYQGQALWPRRINVTLGVELAVLAVFAALWETTSGHPGGGATYVLLAVNATALGIQSGAVLRFGVSGLSTTYLTGTLTQFVAGWHGDAHRFSARSLAILVALVSGAAIGAVLAVEARRFMPVAPLGVIAVVIVGSHFAFRSEPNKPVPPEEALPTE